MALFYVRILIITMELLIILILNQWILASAGITAIMIFCNSEIYPALFANKNKIILS